MGAAKVRHTPQYYGTLETAVTGHRFEPINMKLTKNIFTLTLATAGLLAAQGAPDNGKLLTTFQNPVGDLISVPFQNNINFPIGQFSRIQDVLNIQPVVPIHLNEDWLVI